MPEPQVPRLRIPLEMALQHRLRFAVIATDPVVHLLCDPLAQALQHDQSQVQSYETCVNRIRNPDLSSLSDKTKVSHVLETKS